MKSIVVYYSQTGNTKKVARAIHSGMSQLLEHCDCMHVKEADPPQYGSEGNACDMWMGCTFCELICPTGAISGDWEEALKEAAGLGQMFGYNPLEKAAMETVTSGRLRKLVPDEIAGPYFKVHSKRPRFKIPKDE